MKNIIYVFIVLYVSCSLITISQDLRYETPTKDCNPNISVWHSYLLIDNSQEYPSPYLTIHLDANHSYYTANLANKDSAIREGIWYTDSCTLRIVLDWSDWTLPTNYDSLMMEYRKTTVRSVYDMRNFLSPMLRDYGNNVFPRNVAVFKMSRDHDTLYALEDDRHSIGLPISGTAFKEGVGINHFMKIVPANWEDRFSWKKQKRDTDNILYIVRNKVIDDNRTVLLSVENGGLIFTLIHPQYIHYSPKWKSDMPTVDGGWMDKVNIGDSLYLKLYPTFQTATDSILVMDREVYGYWLAEKIQ